MRRRFSDTNLHRYRIFGGGEQADGSSGSTSAPPGSSGVTRLSPLSSKLRQYAVGGNRPTSAESMGCLVPSAGGTPTGGSEMRLERIVSNELEGLDPVAPPPPKQGQQQASPNTTSPSLPQSGSQPASEERCCGPELPEVMQRLRKSVGIKTRSWYLKKYKRCFVGEEAVKWMIFEGLASNTQQAVMLGQALWDAGYIEHVTGDHSFANAYFFYRITEVGAEAANRQAMMQAQSPATRNHATQLENLRHQVAQLSLSLAETSKQQASQRRQVEAALARARSAERSLSALLLPLTALAFAVGGFWGSLAVLGTILAWGCLLTELGWTMWQQKQLPVDDIKPGPLVDPPTGPGETLLESSKLDSGESEDDEEEDDEEHGVEVVKEMDAEGRVSCKRLDCRYDGLPHARDWPDRPVLLLPEPGSGMQLEGREGIVRTGRVHRFETEIFSGCAVLRIAGLPTSEPGQFGKKRRKLQMVVQGRFKREIAFSELRAGQQFGHPFTRAPSAWVISAVIKVAQAVSPCYSLAGPREPRPGMTGLMVGLAQSLCVSEPGLEPDPLGEPVEDTRLLGPKFPATFSDRKRVFSGSSWEDGVFDTRRVWTFGFWEAPLSIATFELDLGVMGLSVGQYIADQPLILASTAGGQTLYSFQIWHEQFVPPQLRDA